MNIMKRVAANVRVAIHQEGVKHHQSGDFASAFEYYTKAAELGDAEAHYLLSLLYGASSWELFSRERCLSPSPTIIIYC